MFKCDKCGICCRSIKNNPIYKHLDRGDGICKYLDEQNLCSIYETRPLICNVDEAFSQIFSSEMSKEEYYKLNYESCKKLKLNINH